MLENNAIHRTRPSTELKKTFDNKIISRRKTKSKWNFYINSSFAPNRNSIWRSSIQSFKRSSDITWEIASNKDVENVISKNNQKYIQYLNYIIFRNDSKGTTGELKLKFLPSINSWLSQSNSSQLRRPKALKLIKNLRQMWYKGKYQDIKQIPGNPFVNP